MDIQFYLFSAFYLLVFINGAQADHCNQDEVDLCWKPVDEYLRSQGHDPDHKQFALFQLTTEHLTSYCHIYKNSSSGCLAALKGHCSFDDRKVFEGLEDSLDFFCSDGFDGYLQHKDCIGADDTQKKIHSCSQQFEDDVNDIIRTARTESEVKSKYCDAVYDSVDCDREAVEDMCGKEAGAWVETYETKLYQPYMEQYNCQRGNQIAVIVGSIIAVVAVLILGVCAFTCYYHHRQNKQRQSRRYMANSNMAVFNNGSANAQPQVALAATATTQAEKAGLPPDYSQIQSPPYPGIFMQPSPPPSYYPPSTNEDDKSAVTGATQEAMQQQPADANNQATPVYTPAQYGSEISGSAPQYTQFA